jgi:ParB family chromosome partitioning protein
MSPRDPSPRLGRGLAALLGDAVAAPHRSEAEGPRQLPIEVLGPSPYQPRSPIDPASLRDLTDSIRARGILQPLLARPDPGHPGRYEIIAGERRWRAAQVAGLHEVPVLVRLLSDAEAMAAALVENLQRQDLNPIEEAEGYRRLIDEFAMTQDALGEAVGKSRSHIANTMRLLNLPATVQTEVRNGALTAGHARALLSHPEPAKAALAVIARGMNVRQTEAMVARRADIRDTADASGGHQKSTEAIALERSLTARLGLKVEIASTDKNGVMRIHFKSLDQLDGLVTLLTRD